MDISKVSTKDLKKELQKRESTPGVWKVIKYLRDDRDHLFEPKYIHLVEDIDGNQVELQLVGNIYNNDLNKMQPGCSDEDSNWNSKWEEYFSYSIKYFIGKSIKIDSFDPLKISQII